LNPKEVLAQAELLVGILAALPYRSELDVGHLLLCASRFLTLRTAPLLSEGLCPASPKASFFNTCAVSVLLHALCAHLCADPAELERLLLVAVMDTDDQPLAGSFWRRPQFDITELLAGLSAVAGNALDLVSLLQRRVPMDSPLLRIVECQGGGTRGRVSARGCRRRHSVGCGRRQRSPAEDGQHQEAEGDAENETSAPKMDRPKKKTGVKRQRCNSTAGASDGGVRKQPPQEMEDGSVGVFTMEG